MTVAAFATSMVVYSSRVPEALDLFLVTALIGGVLGMAVGVFLALLVTHALSSEGIVFAVPWTSLVIFVVATILVGVLASIFPARRAARLNVLEALQYE